MNLQASTPNALPRVLIYARLPPTSTAELICPIIQDTMDNFLRINHLFYRFPWIHPVLWLLVALWTVYLALGQVLYVTSTIWRCFAIILGWWWAIAKTILVLCGQLCIAVPGTGIVYLTAVYVIYPIITVSHSYFLQLVDLAMSPSPLPPPPPSYQYTHTHSNGQSYTHTHDAEEVEEMQDALRSVLEEKLRDKRAREEREMRQQCNTNGTGKSKRKGKKRR